MQRCEPRRVRVRSVATKQPPMGEPERAGALKNSNIDTGVEAGLTF